MSSTVEAADWARLPQIALDDDAIMEALQVAAVFSALNRLADAFGEQDHLLGHDHEEKCGPISIGQYAGGGIDALPDAAPAPIEDEQTVQLGAADRIQDGRAFLEVDPGGQSGLADDDPSSR